MYTACLRFGLDIMQCLDTQEQSLHHNIDITSNIMWRKGPKNVLGANLRTLKWCSKEQKSTGMYNTNQANCLPKVEHTLQHPITNQTIKIMNGL